MADMERSRVREKEPPPLSNYELALKRAKETAERNLLEIGRAHV